MKNLVTAVLIFLVLTVITGLVYPLLVTGIAQVVFPRQANGSLIERDGKVVGSELIGQPFAGPTYFWSRPSATGPFPYNAAASSGSNLGPTNPVLFERVKTDLERIQKAHPGPHGKNRPVPVDLVTASASGLDPHISPASAFYQVERIAAARGLAPAAVRRLVEKHTEGRTFGLLGESRVNVLRLNLDLDRLGRIPSAEGATACSLGRQPQVGEQENAPSPEGAAGSSRNLSPLQGSRIFTARLPGAGAPGYMPSPLRGSHFVTRSLSLSLDKAEKKDEG